MFGKFTQFWTRSACIVSTTGSSILGVRCNSKAGTFVVSNQRGLFRRGNDPSRQMLRDNKFQHEKVLEAKAEALTFYDDVDVFLREFDGENLGQYLGRP
jgi:hypothetical protein